MIWSNLSWINLRKLLKKNLMNQVKISMARSARNPKNVSLLASVELTTICFTYGNSKVSNLISQTMIKSQSLVKTVS
jgi:hypothetical protein